MARQGLQSSHPAAESATRPRRRSRLADTEPDAPEKIYLDI
jgi:hypothetical protein